MNIDTEILQTVASMPESLKREILHCAQYLREKFASDRPPEATSIQKRRSLSQPHRSVIEKTDYRDKLIMKG